MFVLIRLIFAFFRLGITTVKTVPDPVAGTEQAGALIPNSALVQQLGALQQNASPAFGNWSQTVIPASQAASTYNANAMVGGVIRRLSTGGTVIQDSTDTATNIVNAIPGAKVNQTFPMILANLNSSTGVTLAGGTGVTMAGTNVVGGLQARLFMGQVTGSGAVTMTGCFAFTLGSGL